MYNLYFTNVNKNSVSQKIVFLWEISDYASEPQYIKNVLTDIKKEIFIEIDLGYLVKKSKRDWMTHLLHCPSLDNHHCILLYN